MHQSSGRYKAVALLAKFSTVFVDGGGGRGLKSEARAEGEASIQTANHVDEGPIRTHIGGHRNERDNLD